MEWTTVEIRKDLHDRIRARAKETDAKIKALVHNALVSQFPETSEKSAA